MAGNDRGRFEQVAARAIQQLFAASPDTAAFHRGEWLDREYYRRHFVETVLRIRLNNEVDAFALYKIGFKDNALAQILAKYLSGKCGREGLFLRAIGKFGLTVAQVDGIAPFHSTDKLIGYLYLSTARDGPSRGSRICTTSPRRRRRSVFPLCGGPLTAAAASA